MTQNKKTHEVDRHNYTGFLSDLQAYGNNFQGRKYGNVQYDSLSDYQNFLYNRALFGLSVYSQEEIKDMRWDKRKRIIKVHKRAQSILNVWKQQIVNACSNAFFEAIFPGTPITQELLEMAKEIDESYVNKMSFKTLRISKAQVISKLVAEGVLPPDFHNLKTENTCSTNS